MKGKKSKKDRSRIARYRCDSELRRGHYWKEKTEREYRICGKVEESLKHVLKECEECNKRRNINGKIFERERKWIQYNEKNRQNTRREEDGEGRQSHHEPKKPEMQGTIETRKEL